MNEIDLSEPQKEEEDPRVAKFTVSNPIKTQGHVKYSITGVDPEGSFEE